MCFTFLVWAALKAKDHAFTYLILGFNIHMIITQWTRMSQDRSICRTLRPPIMFNSGCLRLMISYFIGDGRAQSRKFQYRGLGRTSMCWIPTGYKTWMHVPNSLKLITGRFGSVSEHRVYLGAGFMPLPMEVLGLGVPERCEPLWFGGNTRGSPNLRYVYMFEPSADLEISLC